MSDRVTIDIVKPENLKDGFDVNIKGKRAEKEQIDLSVDKPEDPKNGFTLKINNTEDPKPV